MVIPLVQGLKLPNPQSPIHFMSFHTTNQPTSHLPNGGSSAHSVPQTHENHQVGVTELAEDLLLRQATGTELFQG